LPINTGKLIFLLEIILILHLRFFENQLILLSYCDFRLVYINQVEFENFKSFGGSVKIPLEEGFTVVTGPNGSGKSNILDGILFCLGLANSRGMRA